MSGGKKPHRGKEAKTISEPFDFTRFDVTIPNLPKRIEEGALRSGGYPYDKRMRRRVYEKQLMLLQIELLKIQTHIRDTQQRIVVLFEGRDSTTRSSDGS